MDELVNISRKIILIKDLNGIVDFDLVNKQISSLEFGPNVLNRISTKKNIFDAPEFSEIKQTLERECEHFLKNGHHLTDFENLQMTTSWVNITDPGHAHHEHNHPFSVVSGVIYLDNNPDNLNLGLQVSIAEIPYFLWKKDNCVTLKALIGTENNLKNHMVLFLSNTAHSVEKTNSDSMPRRSISFNTFWKGMTGVRDMAFESITF
jgi:uncharacterized protein (TIGR02466 family)